MSIISPYISWTPVDDVLNIISFDVLEEENPTFSSLITKYPIEKGSDITDHTQSENDKLSITAMFVDYPLAPGGGGRDSHPEEIEFDGGEGRALRLFNMLDFIRRNSILIFFRSARLQMQNCLIKHLDYKQNKNSGNGIRFVMQIEKQTFVESKRVKTKRPKTAAGQECKNQGDKTGDNISEAEKKKKMTPSALKNIKDTGSSGSLLVKSTIGI